MCCPHPDANCHSRRLARSPHGWVEDCAYIGYYAEQCDGPTGTCARCGMPEEPLRWHQEAGVLDCCPECYAALDAELERELAAADRIAEGLEHTEIDFSKCRVVTKVEEVA